MSKAYDKNRRAFENSSTKVGYDKWNPLAEGNYGKVSLSPDGKRVVKELLVGKDGKKGEFGEFEVDLATKMGKLGHSPKIHSHSPDHIEMDVAPGKPLWKSYARGEDEPQMTTTQARKAAAAIRDLHKMGYAHGDLHALQFIVDGDNVKLVDYGLSVPVKRQPSRVMQDLSKIAGLLNWKNPELANDPYVSLVNKYLDEYKEVKGVSKAANNKRTQIGEAYLRELNRL
jgi:tRNA A-37 threonylcarbamoyl transferase component Bud32